MLALLFAFGFTHSCLAFEAFAIIQAIKNNDLPLIEKMIASENDAELYSNKLSTIRFAAQFNNQEIVKAMLDGFWGRLLTFDK